MNLGLTILKGRRSIRKYKEQKIEDEVIKAILESARYAPTARNAQAWKVGVIKNKDTLLKLSELASHGKFIKDADVCFTVFAEKEHQYFVEDGSAMTMQILLSLWSFGVGSCWVAGYGKEYSKDVQKLLKVPEKYTLISLIPAGYPAEVTIPTKKELEDIVFEEEYSE
ncbi:nitroreductase family protein [Methanomicrobium antiquum]|uniref:Nitroreductase family protein n=1 Tax=Methanomicrobium antiquum TaxID=487686 RepID=A0AAF0JM69_9EURY|nr:nitroreductase family protein [Methanomicrobium antiquum]WFN36116.1 nitroreductase family protein [Methanomicrobium antiquum]